MRNDIIKNRSWLRRNLFWLFPVILIIITGVYLIFSGVIGIGDFAKAYADKPVFEEAVRQVRQNVRAKSILGEIAPIDRMTIAEGTVQYTDNGEAMAATITLKGSKSKGKLDIEAHKVNGAWMYDKISVRTKEPKEEIVVLP